MDPTEVFLHNRKQKSPITERRIWDFYVRAFYTRRNFSIWVKEASIWEYVLKYDILEFSSEEQDLGRIRQQILDFEEEFYKDVGQ